MGYWGAGISVSWTLGDLISKTIVSCCNILVEFYVHVMPYPPH